MNGSESVSHGKRLSLSLSCLPIADGCPHCKSHFIKPISILFIYSNNNNKYLLITSSCEIDGIAYHSNVHIASQRRKATALHRIAIGCKNGQKLSNIMSNIWPDQIYLPLIEQCIRIDSIDPNVNFSLC